jgi:hypothetical protein
MKKIDEERIKELTTPPSFRKLLKSVLLFLKAYFRKGLLKDDPALPKKKRRRPRG